MSKVKPSYRVVAPDRHVRLEPAPGPVAITLRGAPVAGSDRAVALFEGGRPPVWYLPGDDVRPGALVRSARRYACRWKGDARYYHVQVGGSRIEDGAWEYPAPPEDVAGLAGHVAFDGSAFDISPAPPLDDATD